MLLKYISINELNFSSSWENGLIKIKAMKSFEKVMTIFWLFGPLIYLIERDPADLWLTLICIIFCLGVPKKRWSWISQIWFKIYFMSMVVGLFSALTSTDISHFNKDLFGSDFLYVAAAQVWLARDRISEY